MTDRKAIGVTDYMLTNVDHIYAIGDVTGLLRAVPGEPRLVYGLAIGPLWGIASPEALISGITI